jgi:hypothetical protein
VVQQLPGLARVFAGDAVGLTQDAQRTKRDVFQIADRRRDQVETGRERRFVTLRLRGQHSHRGLRPAE